MLTFKDDWTVFDAPVQTIVNTVNCVGVMGKGLALEVKKRFPLKRRGITSVVFPPLGCGAGGPKWEEVKPVMEKHLGGLRGIDIYVCLAPPKPESTLGPPHRPQRKPTQREQSEQLGLPLP